MWPAMIAGPSSPGVGPPVYQPAGKPLGGTSSDPSARKPRSISPESTPIAAIRTRTGVDLASGTASTTGLEVERGTARDVELGTARDDG
jgi:hypothetical protein